MHGQHRARIEHNVQLGTAAVGRVAGPALRLQGQAEAGGVDQADSLARGSAQPWMSLREQYFKQPAEHLGRPLRVGIGERGALGCGGPQVIQARVLAGHRRLDLAQARSARQLRVQQSDQLALAAELAHAPVRAVLVHKRIEAAPGNALQQAVQERIVVPHGVDPFRVR